METRSPKHNIPNQWSTLKIGDIAQVVMGQSPSSAAYNGSGKGLTLVQGNADIVKGKTISRIWTSEITKTAEKGEIILTVRAPVGAVGLAHEKICIGRGVCSIKSDSQQFLWHYFKYFEPKWSSLEQGSTFTAVNGADIRKISISLPSLPEQKRIVLVLETWDKAIDVLIKKIEFKRQVKKGFMQELLTGRIRLPGFTEEWKQVSIGEVCKLWSGFPFPSEFFSEEKGIRVVRNRDLKGSNKILYYFGRDIPDSYTVFDGDILVGMDGDFLTCRWSKGRALLNQRVGKLTAFNNANKDYLFYKIQIPLKIIEQETSSTTVKHLSAKMFESFKVILPPKLEQDTIANILTTTDKEIRTLERKLRVLQEQKRYLLNKLITGAIRTPETLKT